MIKKSYKACGIDVDDFMIMNTEAYHNYTMSTIKSYLFYKGYSAKKLNTLQIGLSFVDKELTIYKALFFLQEFSVYLEVNNHNNAQPDVIHMTARFFNSENKLCAINKISMCLDHNSISNYRQPSHNRTNTLRHIFY